MNAKIKHVDGKTEVMAKVLICDSYDISLDYRLQGMSYSRTLTLTESIKMGIVKKVKATNTFRELIKGKVYKILSFDFAEDHIACGKGEMIIRIAEDADYHWSNFYPAN